MRAEIFMCDLCKKVIEEKNIIRTGLDLRWYELCEECAEKIKGVKQEIEACREKQRKEIEAIYKKHGLGE